MRQPPLANRSRFQQDAVIAPGPANAHPQSPETGRAAYPLQGEANARHLLWFAGVSWDGPEGTDRRMVTALSQYTHILWVDPPASIVSPRRYSSSVVKLRRQALPTITPVDRRITRLTPVALPGKTRPGIRWTTAPLTRAQTHWALRKTGIRPFAAVAGRLEDLLGYWGSDVKNVFYGTDDHVAAAELRDLSPRWLSTIEQTVLRKADLVIAVSAALEGKWAAFGAKSLFIPNGCYITSGGADTRSPDLNLEAPVIGLVGILSDRIDLDVLNKIVDAGFSLLIVGPRDPSWEPKRFPALIARRGVHYTGAVPAEAVPSYLAGVDVGITPYRDSEFNRGSFPLKTLEYLGAGIPVVSADLPSARWLQADLASKDASHASQVLSLASNPAEFVLALRRLVGDPVSFRSARQEGDTVVSAGLSAHCRAFAEHHTWSRRAEAFAEAIGLGLSDAKYGHDGFHAILTD
jgi:teichuronic acid biosynthesis glycosyltransferase TuaH